MVRAPRLPGVPVDPDGTTNPSRGNQTSSSRQAPASWQSRDGVSPEAGTGSSSGQGTANPRWSAVCWQDAWKARLVGTGEKPSISTVPAGRADGAGVLAGPGGAAAGRCAGPVVVQQATGDDQGAEEDGSGDPGQQQLPSPERPGRWRSHGYGSRPVATGREGSVTQSLQEPAYSDAGMPATSQARTRWAATTPEPQ